MTNDEQALATGQPEDKATGVAELYNVIMGTYLTILISSLFIDSAAVGTIMNSEKPMRADVV